MARDLDSFLNIESDRGPLLVNALIDQGFIEERKFSFYFSRVSDGPLSYVDFGAPQPQSMRDPSEIQYIKVLDDFFWSAYNQGVGIGGTSEEQTYGYSDSDEFGDFVVDNSLFTIIDTGSSAINFSLLYFEDFILKIFEYVGERNF